MQPESSSFLTNRRNTPSCLKQQQYRFENCEDWVISLHLIIYLPQDRAKVFWRGEVAQKSLDWATGSYVSRARRCCNTLRSSHYHSTISRSDETCWDNATTTSMYCVAGSCQEDCSFMVKGRVSVCGPAKLWGYLQNRWEARRGEGNPALVGAVGRCTDNKSSTCNLRDAIPIIEHNKFWRKPFLPQPNVSLISESVPWRKFYIFSCVPKLEHHVVRKSEKWIVD